MKTERRFKGTAVSPGIARGKVFIHGEQDVSPPFWAVEPDAVPAELARLNEGIVATRRQIEGFKARLEASARMKDAEIFDAQVLVVEDGMILGEVRKLIERGFVNAEHAYYTVAMRFARSLAEIEDPYLAERAVDIKDVARRVVHNLLRQPGSGLSALRVPSVVLANDITPSDTVMIDRRMVLGFATEVGSKISHTAIMARSLNIPAVVGLHEFLGEVTAGDDVLLDGYGGLVIINPTEATLYQYGEFQSSRRAFQDRLTVICAEPTQTLDGQSFLLGANIESPDDVVRMAASGAMGVGLFRTEFLYLERTDFPTEEEQWLAYRKVAEAAGPHPVVIRTLDLGGDKVHGAINEKEGNPFLGWRAIRLCLERLDLFKPQLRAILRASPYGDVKLLIPMLSGVDELRRTLEILEMCKAELRHEGLPFNERMEVGAMIEVPSAAICADQMAREVDFFSLGTNDLVQYTVAADRTNERVAGLYEPTHPAILRLIRTTVEAARAAGIWVGVCGEMGGDPYLTPLLLGLGLDEISAGAAVVPRIKYAIRHLNRAACMEWAHGLFALDTPGAVFDACEQYARSAYPELLDE